MYIPQSKMTVISSDYYTITDFNEVDISDIHRGRKAEMNISFKGK